MTPDNTRTQDSHAGSKVLWGFYEIIVDIENETVEAIPLRGVMFNANVVKFLQPPVSPINMLTININPGSDIPNGYIDVNVTIRHPFFGVNKFKGFDVRGIVMGEPVTSFTWDPSATRTGAGELELLNADGYTRWWNPVEFTTFDTILGYTQGVYGNPNYTASTTVNPYKYFSDSLDEMASIETLDINSRGIFNTDPGLNKRNYLLQFPVEPIGPDFRFNYAVDASWALPDTSFEPDYPPEAFPAEANMQEAWLATVDDSESTAWFVSDDANGGILKMGVEVFDWQVMFTGSTVATEISAIWLESSAFPGPVNAMLMTAPEPGGPVSSVWNVEITDLTLSSSGSIPVWVGVEAVFPVNYAPQVEADPSFFDWPDKPLTAFFKDQIVVGDVNPNDPPIVLAVNPPTGLVSTVETDINIIGENFVDGAAVEFMHDTSATLPTNNLVWVNENLLTCDVDCTGPLGFYDVTVTNPDLQFGTLDDGFEVIETWECSGSAHDWVYDEYTLTIPVAELNRNSMAIMKSGSRAGMAVMQMSSSEWGTFDPELGADQTVSPFFTTPSIYTMMMTTDEFSGRLAIESLFASDSIFLYDDEGVALGTFKDPGITRPDGHITSFDFDKFGDLWAVVKIGLTTYEIRHYSYLETDPFYELVPDDTIDVTDIAMTGPLTDTGVGDIGISFFLHRLFIFTSNTSDGGTNKLTSWDLNVSPPVLLNELQNPYPPTVRKHIFGGTGAFNRLNVDVDHRFPDDKEEQCRVYTYATVFNYSGNYTIDCYIQRWDGDLNHLDTGEFNAVPYPSEFGEVPQWAVINDYNEMSSANIISSHWAWVSFQSWPAPPDW